MQQTPDTDNAVTHDESFITVTISREDAVHWVQRHPRAIGQYEQRIANAVRAALEEQM
jgi:biopolymer transport protein ExbD